MKRKLPWDDQVDVISSDDSSSSDADKEANVESAKEVIKIEQPVKEMVSEGLKHVTHAQTIWYHQWLKKALLSIHLLYDVLIKRAEMYQEYMKTIPIPTSRGSVIPFRTWTGLARSMKQLYGQPLHYLTNILLKQWDQLRVGSEDEHRPLDLIIHPSKAEANIWLVEEVHRLTSSHHHIAKLWLLDSMHHVYVDPIFPQLQSTTRSSS